MEKLESFEPAQPNETLEKHSGIILISVPLNESQTLVTVSPSYMITPVGGDK